MMTHKLCNYAVFAALFAALGTAAHAQVDGGRLPTRWDTQVSPSSPLPEYPRPQMTRTAWQSLNGSWSYGLTASGSQTPPGAFGGKILVPYPYEAALSGVNQGAANQGTSIPDQRLWYRCTFTVPAAWRVNGQRILLHFGAVNWDSSVSVNGKLLGTHRGGYDPFDYDMTDALKPGQNTLTVSAWNPVRVNVADAQVTGKQRLKSEGYAYTACTGIWQTVWMEPVAAAHIAGLTLTPDIDAKTIHITVQAAGTASSVKVVAADGAKTVAAASGMAGTEFALSIPSPHLWSPSDPHLYDLKVSLVHNGKVVDSIGSYFAMRKISLGKDDQGRTRLFLNNHFLLQVGMLDQGYWPDGIYTAPTDTALRYDITEAKALGFNLLRKHAKVEPERWYYWTDKLGMLVWQDMPQAFGGDNQALTDDSKAQWLVEWKREIATHINHPSIIVWTTFNEGWGQHDTEAIVSLTKQLDPSRLVNNASGFVDKGVGDLVDAHDYPGPGSSKPEPARAAVNGEFGGVTRLVDGHRWDDKYVGYGGIVKNNYQFDKRYQNLLKHAYALSDSLGTSAFVYTQITDVEEESNGLMTYDRGVVKADPEFIAAANRGSFLPLPVNPNSASALVPTSEDDPQIWSYTTQKPSDDWTKPGYDASAWKTGPAPFGQGAGETNTPWTDTPGDIWLRRTVTLPADIPAKLDVVTFHDEDVEVYVNGVLAASAPGYVSEYVHLPLSDSARAAMKPGAPNLIAVHCHQTTGGQIIDVGLSAAGQ